MYTIIKWQVIYIHKLFYMFMRTFAIFKDRIIQRNLNKYNGNKSKIYLYNTKNVVADIDI
jgi:hypothetical protein